MTNQIQITIFFAMSRLSEEIRPQKGILIYPSTENWNDFGHRTLFEFVVLGNSETAKARTFRLGFLDSNIQPEDVIQKTLASKNTLLAPASDFPQFFSLQTGMDAYREIVKQNGPELAEKILMSIHDLVAVRRKTPIPKWVNRATKSEIFSHSLVRSSESFFAYYNASSILSGLSSENLHAVSSSLNFKFHLPCFSNEHNFHFLFETKGIIPKRMAILIGKNGVGKSQTLNQLVLAALDGKETLTDSNGKRPLLSRIIAICTPGETETTFPPVPTKAEHLNYIRLSAAPGERADTGGQTLPEVILQLARTMGTIGSSHRWDIFREAVSRIISFESLRIIPPLPPQEYKVPPAVMATISSVDIQDLRYGGEQRCLDAARKLDFSGQLVRQVGIQYVPLSSGQLSFIRLAAQLCLHIENGSLLLIDEPETHLHPNLVTDLVAMLNHILELSGSIAIVATHSAYLVREVPGSQVHVIKESSNRAIDIVQPRLRTFGADVGAISNFIFGDDIVNRLIEDVRFRLRESPNKFSDCLDQLQSELSTEALMHLSNELDNLRGNVQ